MMNSKILVIDDNLKMCKLIKMFGEKQYDYQIDYALNIKDAISLLEENIYSVVTLDIELENDSGLQQIGKLRDLFSGPILFVSCVCDIETIIEGFNKGADDYITKPFDLNELFLRINRSLIRSQTYPLKQVEDYKIDSIKNEVYLDGHKLNLSEIATKILIILLENKNHSVAREEIFKAVWGSDYTYSTRVIDTHISYIRKETNDIRIRSIRGKGYSFEVN